MSSFLGRGEGRDGMEEVINPLKLIDVLIILFVANSFMRPWYEKNLLNYTPYVKIIIWQLCLNNSLKVDSHFKR
jgi:hypothetical protein